MIISDSHWSKPLIYHNCPCPVISQERPEMKCFLKKIPTKDFILSVFCYGYTTTLKPYQHCHGVTKSLESVYYFYHGNSEIKVSFYVIMQGPGIAPAFLLQYWYKNDRAGNPLRLLIFFQEAPASDLFPKRLPA